MTAAFGGWPGISTSCHDLLNRLTAANEAKPKQSIRVVTGELWLCAPPCRALPSLLHALAFQAIARVRAEDRRGARRAAGHPASLCELGPFLRAPDSQIPLTSCDKIWGMKTWIRAQFPEGLGMFRFLFPKSQPRIPQTQWPRGKLTKGRLTSGKALGGNC